MDTAKSVTLVDLEQEAITVRTEIAALAITDQASYDLAVEKRTAAKSWLKNAEEWFDGIQKPAYDAYKNILNQRKLVCEPTEAAIKKINSALVAFDQEQERFVGKSSDGWMRRLGRKPKTNECSKRLRWNRNGVDVETVNAVLDAPIEVARGRSQLRLTKNQQQVVYRDNWSAECFDLLALSKLSPRISRRSVFCRSTKVLSIRWQRPSRNRWRSRDAELSITKSSRQAAARKIAKL
jgi:hypothetical protein